MLNIKSLILSCAVLHSIVLGSTLSSTCEPVSYTEFYPSKEKCKCLLSEQNTKFTKIQDGGTTTLHLFDPKVRSAQCKHLNINVQSSRSSNSRLIY